MKALALMVEQKFEKKATFVTKSRNSIIYTKSDEQKMDGGACIHTCHTIAAGKLCLH